MLLVLLVHQVQYISAPQPSDVVPLTPHTSKTGFIVSAHRLINITLLTLVQATSKGRVAETYILKEDAHC